MSGQSHIIGRQVIDLQISSEVDALRVQQDVSFAFRNRLIARLSDLFDRLVPDEVVIRLDQLVLEIGDVDPDRLEADFEQKLLFAAEHAIVEKLQELMVHASPGTAVRQMSQITSVLELWMFFLSNGYLPWWSLPREPVLWEEEIIAAINTTPAVVNRVIGLLKRNPTALERMIDQFPDTVLEAVMDAQQPGMISDLLPIRSGITRLDSEAFGIHAAHRRSARKRFWESALAMSWGSGGIADRLVLFIQNLLRTYASDRGISARSVVIKWLRAEMDMQATGAQATQLIIWQRLFEIARRKPAILELASDRDELQLILGDLGSGKEIEPDQMILRLKGLNKVGDFGARKTLNTSDTELLLEERELKTPVDPEEISRQLEQDSQLPGLKPAQSSDRSDIQELPIEDPVSQNRLPNDLSGVPVEEQAPESITEGEEIFVLHAGIVIVHAFLIPLFEKLELIHEKEFVSSEAQEKAVHVVGYLASGEQELPEYQMVLYKILCGIPLHMPVAREIDLSTSDVAEAEHLLKVIIEYWKALRNTTPDGLRNTFFKREGKLLRRDDGWQLQVERKTEDILLNQLPWGIGMVKLPWMPELLRVEWQY